MKSELLHVIGVYSNPRRYQSRSRLLREWIPHMLDSGVRLHIVEHAFGERPYELDAEAFPHVNITQLRGGPEHELWLKESLVNAGIARLPDDAKYVCWEDADIKHVQPDWATETVHMLQHYRVGQTWSHSVDLGPKGETVRNEWGHDADRSFCQAWLAGDVDAPRADYGPAFLRQTSSALLDAHRQRDYRQHYGYSWAIRRDALKSLGRLIDWLVTGSADYHMAMAFAGFLSKFDERMSPGYIRRLKEFARRADAAIQQDIGCVPGTILHGWHGPKTKRFYLSRHDIVRESGFDPDVDLAQDCNGLPTLIGDNRLLRDGLRRYFTARDEDATTF